MKYSEQRELQAQIQLLNDRLDQQDQKHAEEMRELKLQFAGVDEEEEKLKADCLETDLKAFHSRPKWERVQHYKNDEEYTQEWLEHWEDDPRLLKYRENRDGKSATEPKPKSEFTRKSEQRIEPKRREDVQQEVKLLVEDGMCLTDIEELTGVHHTTVCQWIQNFKWDRNLPEGLDRGISRLHGALLDPSLMDVNDTSRVVWGKYVNEPKVIEWFKENNVIDQESEKWQIEVAVGFAGFVGLDNIKEDIEGKDQIKSFGYLSSKYYKKLAKVIIKLVKRGVLHKAEGRRGSAWINYEDVLDEYGEPVLDHNGNVVQQEELRCARMNLLHLNLEMVQ
jgi:hypothetical protein